MALNLVVDDIGSQVHLPMDQNAGSEKMTSIVWIDDGESDLINYTRVLFLQVMVELAWLDDMDYAKIIAAEKE